MKKLTPIVVFLATFITLNNCTFDNIGYFLSAEIRCKVNGKKWTPELEYYFGDYTEELSDTLYTIVARYQREQLYIHIKDLQKLKVGEYTLGDWSSGCFAYYQSDLVHHQTQYKTDSNFTGKFIIKEIDFENHYLKAEFSFIAYNSYYQDTVTITKGKIR